MKDLDIAAIELQQLRNSPEFLANYELGMAHLKRSGIFSFLRIFSRPFITDGGANIPKAAMQASFVDGYHHALADILYFNEIHLAAVKPQKPIRATFGAYGIAVARGDLTEEDIENGK